MATCPCEHQLALGVRDRDGLAAHVSQSLHTSPPPVEAPSVVAWVTAQSAVAVVAMAEERSVGSDCES